MPILRAGPWGNLTDSFQPVPAVTNTLLDHYPVNCAKANWPNQAWAAYYELAGCCTPAQIEVTFPYTNDFGYTIQYHTATIDRGTFGECAYRYDYPDATYFDPVQYVFELYHDGTRWQIEFGNYYFAYWDRTDFVGDECDPVTSFTITSSYHSFYNGYNITIINPNA